MKTKRSTRIYSMILAVVMVLLMVPFSAIITFAEEETSLPTIDYTPFMIDTIDGKTVYNAKSADTMYSFYRRAKKTIDNDEEDYMQSGELSPDNYGFNYTPVSVYYIKPDFAPSCGMLVCMLNYNKDGQDMHTMLIAFKGTDGTEDILTDLLATDEFPKDGYHDGFYSASYNHFNRLSSLRFDMEYGGENLLFEEYIEKMREYDNYNMFVTGHSLGAAVANIFTADFINPKLGDQADQSVVAYTYATPLTCSDANKHASNIFNLINKNDWVPKVGYGITNSEAIFGQLLVAGAITSFIPPVSSTLLASTIYASLEKSYRAGIDLKASSGNFDDRYKLWKMENHGIGGAYSNIKNYVNDNINDYLSAFVLYSNYDAQGNKHQSIIYNEGKLTVQGNGVLRGDWSANTLLDWAKVKDDCTYLVFESDCKITEICDYAFAGMSQLTNELHLPETLTKIGNYAFFHCGFSGDLIIPAGMKEVGINTFNGCSNLDSINAQTATAMTWGYGAFANCVYKDYLNLPIEDLGVDLKIDIFSTYYVEDNSGICKINVKDSTSGNVILPGDKIYYGRLLDEQIGLYPTYDFHYFLTEGNVDTQQSIEAQSKTTIENVASIDEFGSITVDPSCETNKEFTVVVLFDSKGDPNYTVRESTYYIHFTVGAVNNDFEGGLGTEERPYLIKKSSQFESIKDLSAHYKLISDIDFEGKTITPLGTLSGSLDGNGYAIHNFKISVSSDTGLFAKIADGAEVKNLTIGKDNGLNDTYSATIYIGYNGNMKSIAGVVCADNYGTIENCTVIDVHVKIDRSNPDWGREDTLDSIVGGIAGRNYNTIKNCAVVKSHVTGKSETEKDSSPAKCRVYAGGISGKNEGTINSCSSLNNIIGGYTYSKDSLGNEGRAYTFCAGLVARNDGEVSDCYGYENACSASAEWDGDGDAKEEEYCCVDEGLLSNCVTGNVVTSYEISSLNVSHGLHKTKYYVGESLNLYGLVVRDNNGNPLNGYTVSGFESNQAREQTLTVSYKTGYSSEPLKAYFTIIVENIIPESVVVESKEPEYSIGGTLTAADFTATVYYNNGTKDTIDLGQSNDKVKFVMPSTVLNTKGRQVLELKYNYAYMDKDGSYPPPLSDLISIYVSVEVVCDCSSNASLINSFDATTTEYGYTGDFVCSVCQDIIEEGKIIDMLECTNHNYGVWEKYDDNQHRRYCECGELAYSDHAWDTGVVTTAPTCTTEGGKTYTCVDCGATKTESIAINKDAHPSFENGSSYWLNIDYVNHVHECTECGMSVTKYIPIAECTVVAFPSHGLEGSVIVQCDECSYHGTAFMQDSSECVFGDWTTYNDAQHIRSCECGKKEYANHVWDDGVETKAPTYTSVGEKTYTCEDCNTTKTEEIPKLEVDLNSPTITISNKTATAGSTIQIPVSLSNNTGFAYLRIALEYDESILSLESVTNCVSGLVMAQGNNVLSWDSSSSYVGNGELCVLTFKVADGAEVGDYEIKLAVSECYDENTDDVALFAVGGTLSVIDFVYGDANGDGEVNGKDVIVLRKHLVDASVEIFDGADANGDGEKNGKDVIILRRYLVGTAELGPVA